MLGRGRQGAALARELALGGARTRADLRRPAVLRRLPREARANVLYGPRSVQLELARAVAAEVTRRLTFAAESGARFEVIPVGSVRRLAAGAARARSPRVKDVDFLVVAPASALGAPALAAAGLRPPRAGDCVRVVDTYASGARRRSLVLRIDRAGAAVHLRADLFLATDEERPFALFHYTGPAQYNIRTRAHAKRRGWRLNQYGVFHRATGRRVRGAAALRTERELALFLGVTYRPPEQRT